MGIEIDEVDVATAPESLLRELADFEVEIEAEELPDDPPVPHEVRIAGWRNIPESMRERNWVLRTDGVIVASAMVACELTQDLENGYGRIQVLPDQRGKGYARELAEPLLKSLEEEDRRLLKTFVVDGHPAEAFAERLGLKRAYTERRSRLVIAELDHKLMQEWIDRASERAVDYRLDYYRSPLPDEILEQFCDLTYVINLAPRDDLIEDDEVLTPSMWRDMEDKLAAARNRMHIMIAVHEPTGALVGYTQVKTQGLHPDQAWQWGTAVRLEHQNLGLGRWIKAAMIEKLTEERPEVERVDTYNSTGNDPMLNINVAMGFKTILFQSMWQGELATVRENLGL